MLLICIFIIIILGLIFESDAAIFVPGFVFPGALLISAMVGPDHRLA